MQINQETEQEIIKKQIIKNQKEWIPHFNNKGQKMISAPDMYDVVKKENEALIESFKKNLKESYVVTSTSIIYNKDNLSAEIIHDTESTIVKEKRIKINLIPVYLGNEAKEDSEQYLQALFDTKDKFETIIKVLKRYDNSRKIYLWTPTQSSRVDRPVRSVGLYFNSFVRFVVYGYGWYDGDSGLSRGVIVDSAKQNSKKHKKVKP